MRVHFWLALVDVNGTLGWSDVYAVEALTPDDKEQLKAEVSEPNSSRSLNITFNTDTNVDVSSLEFIVLPEEMAVRNVGEQGN